MFANDFGLAAQQFVTTDGFWGLKRRLPSFLDSQDLFGRQHCDLLDSKGYMWLLWAQPACYHVHNSSQKFAEVVKSDDSLRWCSGCGTRQARKLAGQWPAYLHKVDGCILSRFYFSHSAYYCISSGGWKSGYGVRCSRLGERATPWPTGSTRWWVGLGGDLIPRCGYIGRCTQRLFRVHLSFF